MRLPAWAVVGVLRERQHLPISIGLGAGTVLLAILSNPVAKQLSDNIGRPAFYPVLLAFGFLTLLSFALGAILCQVGAEQSWTHIGRGAIPALILWETAFASLHLGGSLSRDLSGYGIALLSAIGSLLGQLALAIATVEQGLGFRESVLRAFGLVRHRWAALLALWGITLAAAILSLLTLGLALIVVVPWYYYSLVEIVKTEKGRKDHVV